MNELGKVGALVGRIFLGFIFILSGLMKVMGPGGTAAYMVASGFPEGIAPPLAFLAGALELVGGLMIAAGMRARLAALVLFLFLIPTTIIFHMIPGGQMNQISTLKNFAIMGGLLILATQGGGGFSLDDRRAAA
ncbi:MAG: DoxX family protein [Candidatus Binataceae bacterium]